MAKRKLTKKATHKLGIISNFDKAIEKENIIAKIEPLKNKPFWQIITDSHTGISVRKLITPNRHK